MKNWRRTATDRGTAVDLECGQQPGELSLTTEGGQSLLLFWDWPFPASGGVLEEAADSAPGVWVVVDPSVVLADDTASWTSSFDVGETVRARLRRLGSLEACGVVSNGVELT